MTYEITICFIDGQIMNINGVTEFGLNTTSTQYYVRKNGHAMGFNRDCVKYIGGTFDINNN